MSQYHRILDARALAANQTQAQSEAWDAGAYQTLVLQFRVVKAGTGTGNVSLEHAAVNEEDAYEPLGSASIATNAAGSAVVSVSSFLRYLRWSTDGGVAGGPVVIIDAIAKGS